MTGTGLTFLFLKESSSTLARALQCFKTSPNVDDARHVFLSLSFDPASAGCLSNERKKPVGVHDSFDDSCQFRTAFKKIWLAVRRFLDELFLSDALKAFQLVRNHWQPVIFKEVSSWLSVGHFLSFDYKWMPDWLTVKRQLLWTHFPLSLSNGCWGGHHIIKKEVVASSQTTIKKEEGKMSSPKGFSLTSSFFFSIGTVLRTCLTIETEEEEKWEQPLGEDKKSINKIFNFLWLKIQIKD